MEDLKQRYNYEIKRYHRLFINSIGTENEEAFSNKLFNLFDEYTNAFGEIHPLEKAINHEAKVRRGELESEMDKWNQFKKDNNISENMKNEQDRMRELVRMFSNKEENFVEKDATDAKNEGLNKEYKRLQNLASGNANSTFKENYMTSRDFGGFSKGPNTVNSIVDVAFDNNATTYQPIRQPLQPEEGFELAIKRALKSGAPVKDMGFYDEVNWHLMSLGFPAKNSIDIKDALLKILESK